MIELFFRAGSVFSRVPSRPPKRTEARDRPKLCSAPRVGWRSLGKRRQRASVEVDQRDERREFFFFSSLDLEDLDLDNLKLFVLSFPLTHSFSLSVLCTKSKKPKKQAEWRGIGVQQSRGWVHYAIHRPEPHVSFL